MLNSVLIANRGEIACRIARTAKRLGMRTIAVYSEADAAAPHVRQCDEALPDRSGAGARSYLSIEQISEGRAGESAPPAFIPATASSPKIRNLRKPAREAGIVFVGPPPSAIRAMGLKDRAKALMQQAGVPVVPGYHGDQQDADFLKRKAYELGYPVLIKAVAGGGGKGMRLVERHADFDAAIEARETRSSVILRRRSRADREIYLGAAPYRDSGLRRQATAAPSISMSAIARCSGAIRR